MDLLRRSKKFTIQPWHVIIAAVVLFFVDRFLKYAALTTSPRPVNGPIAFALFRNTGIAFSIPVQQAIFWPIAWIVLILLIVMLYRAAAKKDLIGIALVIFLLCGALSNLLDRAFYGATIDYLIFFRRSAVNLADGMIVAGVVALLVRNEKK